MWRYSCSQSRFYFIFTFFFYFASHFIHTFDFAALFLVVFSFFFAFICFLFVATFSLFWCHFYCRVYRLLSHLYLRLALTLFCLLLFLFGLHKSNARKIQIITQTKQIKLFFCSRSTFFSLSNIFMCLCISTNIYCEWAHYFHFLSSHVRARSFT